MDKKTWRHTRQYTQEQLEIAATVLKEVQSGTAVMKAVRSHPLSTGGYIAKHTLVHVYRQQVDTGRLDENPELLARIRMKPIRSLSGVSTVTVLTEPYACPGKCLFCPDDKQLPKSYLRKEPGAARAFQNNFDPYLQVKSRLESYQAIGHPTDKIELLILGGSWSAYPQDYREWFVKRCLDAMNGSEAESLTQAQLINQTANSRNVGLVVETRPDTISPQELAHMRYLGVTKVQMGAQSFDDRILELNCRGHSVQDTLTACALLRAAGFKIVLHWMPNLMGATLSSDREDFVKLWDGFCPDELKIYPTQLLREAPLYAYWKDGKYQPYSTEELIDLIADVKPSIPIYSRVNRIIRDIPADYIQAGNKRSSLRLDIKKELEKRGQRCRCIRCREIRGRSIDVKQLKMDDFIYHPADAEEHFISYSTAEDQLAGYLRLSLPTDSPAGVRQQNRKELDQVMPELKGAALIREVHIYGQSLEVGSEQSGAAQHSGLGTELLQRAESIALSKGFSKLAVIAAIGTSLYYEKRGFRKEHLYMTKSISK